ncbi:MAG: helix-turn-helix domain-containing protein [Thermoanaerobaculia bacterium]
MASLQAIDQALRWLRISQKRKQREVAEAAGITQAMLCSYEQGKRQPSLPSLERILDGLGADLADLARAQAAVRAGQSPGPGRAPFPPRAAATALGRPSDQVDLHRLLELRTALPGEQEEALREIFDGFCRWLRLLNSAIPESRKSYPESGHEPPRGSGKPGQSDP